MNNKFISEIITNIDETYIFEASQPHPKSITKRKKWALAASLLICFLITSAFSIHSLSTMYGDSVQISADYWGNGIVVVTAVNQSDKELILQPQIKILDGATRKEVKPISNISCYNGITIPEDTADKFIIDLSQTYDIDKLEEDLYFHLMLTNNSFIAGQKWSCGLIFNTQQTHSEDPRLIAPPYVDPEVQKNVLIPLQPYFEKNTLDIFNARHPLAFDYLELVQEILSEFEGEVVMSVSPLLIIEQEPLDGSVIFDENVPYDRQFYLTGQNHHIFDGQYKIVGSGEHESALVLKTYIQSEDYDYDIEIPLVYYFTYNTDEISPEKYSFIHGQINTFAELEKYMVFQDEKFTVYQVTDLFYTDMEAYVTSVATQWHDIDTVSEDMLQRVRNIYNYYTNKENIKDRFIYK